MKTSLRALLITGGLLVCAAGFGNIYRNNYKTEEFKSHVPKLIRFYEVDHKMNCSVEDLRSSTNTPDLCDDWDLRDKLENYLTIRQEYQTLRSDPGVNLNKQKLELSQARSNNYSSGLCLLGLIAFGTGFLSEKKFDPNEI